MTNRPATRGSPRVVVRVQRLSARGIAGAEAARVAPAFRTELARVLAADPPSSVADQKHIARISATLPAGNGSELARAAARAVHRGLGPR